MQFEIPENAHVVINIGSAPVRALTDETGTRETPGAPRRSMRPWLMVLISVVAFGVGHMVHFGRGGTNGGAVPALAAARSETSPMPAGHLSPAETELPPAFKQSLNQPARVTPAPGKTSPSAPARNPFGLQN